MHIAVRARRLLVLHPSIYWIGCLVFAVGAGTIVRQQLVAIDEARASWGETQAVLVAATDIEPGAEMSAEGRRYPVAVVPVSALADIPAGAVARQRVAAGEIIVDADVTATDGPASLADAGTAVVGITSDSGGAAAVGLDVQVVADGLVIADRGRIVGVDDLMIFVAVEPQVAASVAAAAHDGSAGLVFLP